MSAQNETPKRKKFMIETAKLIEQVTQRKAQLAKTAIELKQHFVGIDPQIDSIIDNITTWYIMPELMTRPVTICLFGPTGVGKTDLVRRLVKSIQFQDKYCEVEMANKNDEWKRSIASIINSTAQIESGKPAILLLDEIQNFRTKDEQGNEIQDCEMKDVWALLSDGKLAFRADLDNLLSMLWSYEKKELAIAAGAAKLRKIGKKAKKMKKGRPVFVNDDDDDEVYMPGYYELNNFKSTLRLSEPIQEIAKWTDKQKKDAIIRKLSDKSIYEEEDFSKCLIFISGNIDEAYGFTRQAEEVDIEADILHEKSKRISILDIKAALGRRFRPEQISRFGNAHVIYPTISRFAFETIIQRKIDSIRERVEKQTGVRLNIDKTVNKLVYDNGVFPTQGTRPVFSTISEIVETPLPDFLLQALVKDANEMTLSYDGVNISAEFKQSTAKKAFVGKLDAVRSIKNNNADRKSLIAVHESAHAVAHAVLFKMSPSQIVSTPASDEMEGFVYPPDMCDTKDALFNRAIACVAGQEAEKMVFGLENQTSGSASDIKKATSWIALVVRKFGMHDWHSFIEMEQETTLANNDLASSNPIIEKLVGEARVKARSLLQQNKAFLIETIAVLYKQDKIQPEDFKAIAAKHGVEIAINANFTTNYVNFDQMLKDFVEKNKE